MIAGTIGDTGTMTKLLQDVIKRVRQWPDDRQDEAAQMLLELELQHGNSAILTPEQRREVARIRQNVIGGKADFASDEQVDAFWKSCGI
jgi:hypothetical protein